MTIALLIALATLFALTGASALVARSAAHDARSTLRQTRTDLESLFLQVSALSAAIRRVEGRQTGLSRKNLNAVGSDGLPDPNENPDAWRAAVRRMAMVNKTKGELQ
jgi:hypothetical protein